MRKKTSSSPTRGITVRLWTRLLAGLDTRAATLDLRRDAYLSKLVLREIPRLDAEIATPVSKEASRAIRGELKRLDTSLVTFRFPKEVCSNLDQVCERKNIVRDAFFNRLLFAICTKPVTFLGAAGISFDPVGLPRTLRDQGWDTVGREFLDAPLDAAAAALDDPCWVLRACLEAASEFEGSPGLYKFYDVELELESIRGFRALNLTLSVVDPDLKIQLDDLLGFSPTANTRDKGVADES